MRNLLRRRLREKGDAHWKTTTRGWMSPRAGRGHLLSSLCQQCLQTRAVAQHRHLGADKIDIALKMSKRLVRLPSHHPDGSCREVRRRAAAGRSIPIGGEYPRGGQIAGAGRSIAAGHGRHGSDATEKNVAGMGITEVAETIANGKTLPQRVRPGNGV